MHNLRLCGPPFPTPEHALGGLVAVQSQDFGPAKWSVARRTTGIRDADLDRLLGQGAILRTHVLRPTWHFVLPTDIRWLLDLTAPRVQALNAFMYRQLELEAKVFKKCNARLVRELSGDDQLTREEIGARLRKHGITAEGMRLGYLLMNAELNGLICSGALRGREQTYALLDERAPHPRRPGREEALAELTLRYFTGHGPATAKDFQSWCSLTLADIRLGIALVGSQLEQGRIGDVPCWFTASTPPAKTRATATVHLLQAYDEYIMGYSETKHLLDLAGLGGGPARDRPMFNGVVLLDTQVVGRWKRSLKKDTVIIEVMLFKVFTRAQIDALQVEAGRHAEFLGLPRAIVQPVH